MADLFLLPPHQNMTPEQCLAHCTLDHAEFADVLVLGIGQDGRLICRASNMARKDALWLLHLGLDHILDRNSHG